MEFSFVVLDKVMLRTQDWSFCRVFVQAVARKIQLFCHQNLSLCFWFSVRLSQSLRASFPRKFSLPVWDSLNFTAWLMTPIWERFTSLFVFVKPVQEPDSSFVLLRSVVEPQQRNTHGLGQVLKQGGKGPCRIQLAAVHFEYVLKLNATTDVHAPPKASIEILVLHLSNDGCFCQTFLLKSDSSFKFDDAADWKITFEFTFVFVSSFADKFKFKSESNPIFNLTSESVKLICFIKTFLQNFFFAHFSSTKFQILLSKVSRKNLFYPCIFSIHQDDLDESTFFLT